MQGRYHFQAANVVDMPNLRAKSHDSRRRPPSSLSATAGNHPVENEANAPSPKLRSSRASSAGMSGGPEASRAPLLGRAQRGSGIRLRHTSPGNSGHKDADGAFGKQFRSVPWCRRSVPLRIVCDRVVDTLPAMNHGRCHEGSRELSWIGAGRADHYAIGSQDFLSCADILHANRNPLRVWDLGEGSP